MKRLGLTIILMFTTIFAVAVPAGVSAQQVEDTTPPELVNLSFDPTTIDVTGGDQDVVFTWELTDDLVGVATGYEGFSPTQLRIVSPSAQQLWGAVVHSHNLDTGGMTNGVFKTTVTFPQYSETGIWQIEYVLLVDALDNWRYLYTNDLVGMGLNTKLTVTNMEDPDGDGLSDAEEAAGWTITIYNCDGSVDSPSQVTSNPSQADEDGDGLNDLEEKQGWHVKYKYQYGSNPEDWEWVEYDVKSDPRNDDFDGDGKNDFLESQEGTDPNSYDTDCDGRWDTNDGFEIDNGLNPLDFDTDNDGFADGLEIDLWLEAGYSLDEAVANTNDPAAIPEEEEEEEEEETHCFIATAAYGTPMAGEIEVLREFRDEYLLTNPVGEALVEFYYQVSPPIAEFITEHPSLKPIVRVGLLPAVTMSTVVVNTTPAGKMAIVGSLVLVSVALAVWATRRRGRGPKYSCR